MFTFILILCIAALIFSTTLRRIFGAIFGAIFVVVFGWLIFVSGIVLTVCTIQGNCHILWE